MFYVSNGKIYWLRKHYRFLSKIDMLKDKVLLGDNTIKLSNGYHYLTHTLKQINNMPNETQQTTGKEALAAIVEHYKLVKETKKAYDKNVANHNKMLTKFPKKEREAYAEKLAKYIID